VIRAATLNGAEALGIDDQTGSIEIGKDADFVIVEENPLENLKVLYGTGAIKLTDSNEVVRVGGVKYTIRQGVVYDAKKLLEEVKMMVNTAKEKEKFTITQPGE
jgi:imidazolonepropionase-like amidohydrolase